MTITLNRPMLVESPEKVAGRNQRILDLAYERKLEQAFSWEDEAKIQRRKVVDVDFGSSGYEIAPLSICGQTESIFLHGYCALLAHQLHLRSGLPFAVFTSKNASEDHWAGHVGLLVDEDKFLDVRGVRPLATERTRQRGNAFQIMELDEFLDRIVDEEYRAKPLSFLDELEALHTQWVADHVLRSSGLI